MNRFRRLSVSRQCGFTLVELAVVIIVIGVLAAFAVPRFRDSVERSKASEAFNYLSSVRAAQERFVARQGTYADDISRLDIQMSEPQYFSVGTIEAGTSGSLEDSWSLTLTRAGASAGYGDDAEEKSLPAVAHACLLWCLKRFSTFHLEHYKDQVLEKGKISQLPGKT